MGFLCLQATGSVALVADCGRISFQAVRWLMRETNLAERASTAINATQCCALGFYFFILCKSIVFFILRFFSIQGKILFLCLFLLIQLMDFNSDLENIPLQEQFNLSVLLIVFRMYRIKRLMEMINSQIVQIIILVEPFKILLYSLK